MVRVHTHARTVDTDLLTFRIDSGAKFGNQLAIDKRANRVDGEADDEASHQLRAYAKGQWLALYIIVQVLGGIGAGAAIRFLLPTSEQVTLKIWLTPVINGFDKNSVSYATLGNYGVSFSITLGHHNRTNQTRNARA